MMEKFRLDNKLSMITGGSKGIGFGIAKALFVTGHILYVDGGLLSTFGPSSW